MRQFIAGAAGSFVGWWLGSGIADGYAVHGRAAFTIELLTAAACTVLAGLGAGSGDAN